MTFRSLIPFVLATAVASTACSGKQYAEKTDEVVELPDRYASIEVDGVPMGGWCSDFGSSELDGLVTASFEQNFDLRQAWARLEQVEAIRAQTNAGWWPVVQAEASAGRSRSPSFGPTGATAEESNNFRVSLGASYEVDVWGRLAASSRAAGYDLEAARADVESIAISIAAQAAEAWFDVVLQNEKARLLEEQVEIAEKYLQLTELRLSQGAATALDVNQQNQQIEQLRGQLALIEARRQTALARLALVLGQTPSELDAVSTEELPELPALPDAGVPADLVGQRPDVRAAMARLEAADERTAAAARAKLPTLRLSANVFLQAAEFANLLDDVFWSLTGAIAQTLWSGGRLNAQQKQAEAVAKERLWAWAKVVVQGLVDVESALVLEQQQAIFLERLEAQHKNAEVSLELARDRYRSGTIDYLRVLTTLQSLQQVEQSLLDARRQQLSYRVQLCRALGGDWTQQLQPPAEGDE